MAWFLFVVVRRQYGICQRLPNRDPVQHRMVHQCPRCKSCVKRYEKCWNSECFATRSLATFSVVKSSSHGDRHKRLDVRPHQRVLAGPGQQQRARYLWRVGLQAGPAWCEFVTARPGWGGYVRLTARAAPPPCCTVFSSIKVTLQTDMEVRACSCSLSMGVRQFGSLQVLPPPTLAMLAFVARTTGDDTTWSLWSRAA